MIHAKFLGFLRIIEAHVIGQKGESKWVGLMYFCRRVALLAYSDYQKTSTEYL